SFVGACAFELGLAGLLLAFELGLAGLLLALELGFARLGFTLELGFARFLLADPGFLFFLPFALCSLAQNLSLAFSLEPLLLGELCALLFQAESFALLLEAKPRGALLFLFLLDSAALDFALAQDALFLRLAALLERAPLTFSGALAA